MSMRYSLLLLLAVVAIAGCIGGSTPKVDINNGVVIEKFSADPTDVFDFQAVTFSTDVTNVGGTTAEDVTLKLLGVENAWRQSTGSGTVGEVSKGPFTLKPPNLKDNIQGDSRFFDFTLTAPDLNEGDKASFPVKARVEFVYSTTGSVIVKAINSNQNQILQRRGESVLNPVTESNSDGPVKFVFVRGATPLVIDPDESSTIERDFRFEVSNVGDGWPITDNSVGKVGGSSRGSRITLQAPSGVTLKSCDGITGSPGSFSVVIRSDGRAPISCTLSINTDNWRTKSEGNVVFNVELNYRYFVDSEVSIDVQGTKRGDVSRPGPAPGASALPGFSPSPSASPGASPTASPTVIPAIRLALASTQPSDGATGVPLTTTSIRMAFNKELDVSSISSAVTVFGSREGGIVAGTASVSEDSKTLLFVPSSALQSGSRYTVTVAKSLKSKEGDALVSAGTFSFTTVAPTPTPSPTASPAASPTATPTPTP